jgi:hypothetical protein
LAVWVAWLAACGASGGPPALIVKSPDGRRLAARTAAGERAAVESSAPVASGGWSLLAPLQSPPKEPARRLEPRRVLDALLVEEGPRLPPLAPLAAIAGTDERRLWLAAEDGTIAELADGVARVRGAPTCLSKDAAPIELLSLTVFGSGRVLVSARRSSFEGSFAVELASSGGRLRCTQELPSFNVALGEELVRFEENSFAVRGLAAPAFPGRLLPGPDQPAQFPLPIDARVAAPDELWALAADGAVYRFDGLAWVGRGSVPSARSLWLDERRRPWVGGEQGLWRLTGARWEQVSSRSVVALAGQRSRALWLTGEEEVALFDGEQFLVVAVPGAGRALWVAPSGAAYVGAQVAVPPSRGPTTGAAAYRTALLRLHPVEDR